MVELRQKAKSFFGSILRNTENLLSTGNPIDSLRYESLIFMQTSFF